ncbi:MAG: TRAP transporter substrate-binding protein [Arenicella sp.]
MYRNRLSINVLAFVFLVLMTGSASAQQYKWQIVQSWSKDLPIYGKVPAEFANLVGTMSNGRIRIEVVTKEEHKRPRDVLKMVKSGEFEIGHTLPLYEMSLDVNTLFFSTLPFGFITSEKFAWFYHGGGIELMEEAFDKHGVFAYPGGNSGNQMGGWFKKEVNSLDDLQGLKIRMPGLAGKVMQSLGADVKSISGGELYKALDSGVIDAAEWVGPSMDLEMGFHKIAPYYYTGWHQPGSELIFYVNQKALNELPEDLQSILKTAMQVSAFNAYALIQHKNAINLQQILTEYPDIKIRAFPSEVMRALSRETKKQVDEIADSGDLMTKKIVQSMRNYMDKIRVWTRISDQAYLNNSGL